MKDKRVREKLYNTAGQDLRFTKEDRNKVFQKIRKLDKNITQRKSFVSSSRKSAPLIASLVVVSLCIFLFIPSILPGNIAGDSYGSIDRNASAGESVAVQEKEVLTTLFTIKDDNERIPINLLLSYNIEKNMMKVLSIPRDTYAPIGGTERTTPYDKLSHAYVNGSGGAEDVRTAISKLFDVNIDYHAVMDLETFSTIVDSVNGIEYDIPEDIRVRAISTLAFEFQKGTHRLNGEEVVALLMDSTVVGNSLNEEDQINLINAVVNQTLNVLPEKQLNQFTAKIEGDFPIEQLVVNEKELPSIQLVSLFNGMMGTKIDDAYYIKFEKSFINDVSEELTTFN